MRDSEFRERIHSLFDSFQHHVSEQPWETVADGRVKSDRDFSSVLNARHALDLRHGPTRSLFNKALDDGRSHFANGFKNLSSDSGWSFHDILEEGCETYKAPELREAGAVSFALA